MWFRYAGNRRPRLLVLLIALLANALSHTADARAKPQRWDDVAGGRAPGQLVLAVVAIAQQKITLYDAQGPVLRAAISSGGDDYETPAGVFSVLQKEAEHYSNRYDDAAMPFMQRITWSGIALHAGPLPGYPASHGCIRLPHAFSSLLFGATDLGMTVVITEIPALPNASDAPAIAAAAEPAAASLAQAAYQWHPDRSAASDGAIVSVIVSAADGKAVVMRGGVEVGSAPVRVTGDVAPMAYVLRSWDANGQHWLKLQYAGSGQGMEVGQEEGKRFEAPTQFRRDLAAMLRPGSVVIVTPQSLSSGSTGRPQEVIETDPER